MNDHRPWWRLLAAWPALAVPPAAFFLIAHGVYGPQPYLPESAARPLTLLALAFGAAAGWGLGGWAATGLLRHPSRLAGAAGVLGCVPVLLVGAVYVHALVVFAAW